MNSNYSSKGERRVARDDWKELVDESLIALWPKSSHQTPNMFHGRTKSEDLSAFAAAIQKEPFGLPCADRSRKASLPHKIQPSTSQYGLFNNDASLKYARRRIRLASDFDEMLKRGFPTLSTDQSTPDFTLYISLTPKVAMNSSEVSPLD
ncbi:hypothetical protein DSO57_1013072 [Entomophthora muscae]|uniref:Uncharacterized protein n=1 Tax=Entomophthora muscae TaxID=34485 RepID=A0ACC2SIT4_9FUNG|nr:hypothetical protein DSO57_1013072 [Entomophthora muscae]